MIFNNFTLRNSVLLLFFLGSSILVSQTKPKQFNIPQKKAFSSSDSLSGFNEWFITQEALNNGMLKFEVPIYVGRLKREFINKKYNLKDNNSEWPAFSYKPIGNGGQNQILTPACNNEDFEFGNINGWTDSKGFNSNSQTMAGCCPTPSANYAMMPSSAFDPATNISLASPFGGNWVVRLGDLCTPGEVNRLSKTFVVSATNALFQVAYFAVLEDAAGHPCNATPYVNISMLNCSNVQLSCPSVSVVAPSSSCLNGTPGFTTGTYPSGGVPQMTPSYSAINTVTVPGGTSYYGYYYPPYTYTVGVGTPTGNVISTYTTSVNTYSAVNTVTVPGGTSYYGYYYGPYTYTVGVGTPTPVITTFTAYCQSSGSWSGWKTVSLDLTQYIGTCVTIQLTAAGCAYGGHNGYAYFDTQCTAVNLSVNNSLYPAGSSAFTVAPCGTTSGTVSAPPGLGPYTWNGPAGSGVSSYTNQTFTTTTSGSYTLSMNPPGSCAPITKTVTLLFSPPPAASFTTANTCSTFTITNTSVSTAIQSYTFLGVGAPASFTTTNPTSVVSFPASGSYTIIQSIDTGGGCITYTSGVINVPSGSSAAFNIPSPSQCITGNNFSFSALTSSGIHTYSFNPAVGAPAIGNVPNYSGFFSNVGTYSVTHSYTTTSGCVSFSTAVVSINPMPTITALSSGNVCQNASVTLSASGANSYVWSGPNNFSASQGTLAYTSAPLSLNGNFTVTGTDLNGCSNTATLSQVIFPGLTPQAVGSIGCINDNLTLSVSAGNSYQWTGPNGFSSTLQNPTIPNANLSNSGSYTVVVTPTSGCAGIAVANCSIFPNPTVGFVGNTELCKGATFTFTGTGALNYKWLTMYDVLSLEDSYSISSTSPNLQNTYTLVGADANGCLNSVVITPIVLPLPSAFVTPQINAGCAPFCTTFDLTKQSTNIISALWSFDNGNSYNDSSKVTQCFNTQGIHNVNVDLVDAKSCKSSITNSIEVYPTPHADFIYSPDSPNENDFTVTFADITSNATITNWHWDFYSNGKDTSIKQNPVYDFPNIGNYFVFFKVKSNYGCVDSVIKKLSVVEDVTFYIPNSFTPNGDNNNEIFMPKAVGVKKYHMDIFDRWGQLLFSTSDIEKGWDGKAKKGGDVLPPDVYVYKISVTQNTGKPKQYVGHVTLIK
ncbi:MAG: gliding motility-associated C-terminal domain-containing protein [Bacteroidota bacterium]|nr:gliding motility-associated C-terminal domain-containing protein [Bacteroidota bacterium]